LAVSYPYRKEEGLHLQKWGERQAKHYIRGIQAAIETVAAKLALGKSCDHIREGYRCFPAGSHMLLCWMLACARMCSGSAPGWRRAAQGRLQAHLGVFGLKTRPAIGYI